MAPPYQPLTSIRVVLCAIAAWLAIATAEGTETAAIPAPATVELQASQSAAVTVAALGTHAFPIARDEIGSVALASDLTVVQAESALIAAAAADAVASQELARATTLASGDGISRREFEQARSDRAAASAALVSARAALSALGITDAETRRLLEAGHAEEATPAGAAWVSVSVLESDAPLIHAGLRAEVRIAAMPGRVLHGTVRRAYASVDPLAHRMTARVALDGPADGLIPGMLAAVRIALGDPVVATAIPAHGVVREGDGSWTAWTTADGKRFTQRAIQPGMRDGEWVQVVAGLATEERVVTDGALLLDNMLNAAPTD